MHQHYLVATHSIHDAVHALASYSRDVCDNVGVPCFTNAWF